jgi:hypothetical protein
MSKGAGNDAPREAGQQGRRGGKPVELDREQEQKADKDKQPQRPPMPSG